MIFSRKLYRFSFAQRIFRSSSVLLMILIMRASAQTTITSIPADTATGISPSASIEFDFSGPMDNANTTATFFSSSPPGFYPVDSVWNNANDVLTCTPTTPFPPNTMISWVISGMDANNMQVFANGSFTTESGSGGPTGYGTNQITSFVAGKVYVYGQ